MIRLSRRGILRASGAWVVGTAWTGSVRAGNGRAESSDSLSSPAGPLRLDRNESPFGPSPRARRALRSLNAVAWKYSYDEALELRRAIAEREAVRPENVFIGEGSGEILKLVALIHGEPGNCIVASRPTFAMLPQYATRRGADVTWVDVDERFGHDFDAMRAQVSNAATLVYVCNPNNPTGALADPNELRAFIRDVSPRALVVIDEAYIDYAPDPAKATAADLVASGANILVTRSFSKLYGLAGLRIGYGIGPVEVIRRLESLRFSIPNQAGVAAARASLGEAAFLDDIRSKVRESVALCARLFDELGLSFSPTHGNFMMFDSGRESFELIEFARNRGVMVAPVQAPLSTWIRVSMGRLEDMKVFANTLREFVGRG